MDKTNDLRSRQKAECLDRSAKFYEIVQSKLTEQTDLDRGGEAQEGLPGISPITFGSIITHDNRVSFASSDFRQTVIVEDAGQAW